MALIVQKFGGSSVADRDRIFNVARIVANTHAAGNDVVVVVSAQGDTTDDLIAKAGEITHDPSQREMDMLLATGEQISISLLAMALGETGCPAISLTGWQAGFHTDRAYTRARIKNLDTERWNTEFSREGSIWEETGVIGVTAPIYNDTISVSKNSEIMDADLIAALQQAFINIGNTDAGKEVIAIYSHNGYQVAQASDYDNERAAQKLIQELSAAN